MKIRVDIDNTLCLTNGMDYAQAEPIQNNIDKINKLYDMGHYIIIWSSRGVETGKDYYLMTKNQLDQWGVKYHEIKLDKPFFNLLLDDRAKQIENLSLWDATNET